jgi:hypothetical protein
VWLNWDEINAAEIYVAEIGCSIEGGDCEIVIAL